MDIVPLCLDGNTAAAMAAYKMIDVSAIYPITPSSTMAELIEQYAAKKQLNAFGNVVQVHQTHSELGAAAAVHGAAAAGSLTATFTSSQGLLLMIPNLYFMSTQLLPVVVHLADRSVGTMGTTLAPDHSDIYAISNTNCSAICSRNAQECHDMALASHISAVNAMTTFVHFFEGFRVSHQFETFTPIPNKVFEEAAALMGDKLAEWRSSNIVNPSNPEARGLGLGSEVYYQIFEAHTKHFLDIPGHVQRAFDFVGQKTGRHYQCFEYYGHNDAEDVIIIVGCSALNVQNIAERMSATGKKVGVINVRLWRPFSPELLLKALPFSVKRIAVMDRSRDLAACGELLYKEVMSALFKTNVLQKLQNVINISYGLAGVDLTPGDILAVYQRLSQDIKVKTLRVGLIDDLMPQTCLPPVEIDMQLLPDNTKECIIYAIGSDGTIGAVRNAMKLLQDENANSYCQANFEFDGKKSGGLTISYLRFGPEKVLAQYNCEVADYVSCHTPAYVGRYDFLAGAKHGATFVLNCDYVADIETRLPGSLKRQIAQKKIHFIPVDCNGFAKQAGLGNRISMATVMFLIRFGMNGLLDFKHSAEEMKKLARQTYAKASAEVLDANMKVVDLVVDFVGTNPEYKYNEKAWLNAEIETLIHAQVPDKMALPFMTKMEARRFKEVTTSDVQHCISGSFPSGFARYEKPATASDVPEWISNDCIQCCLCSASCPHGSIRPVILEDNCQVESLDIKGSKQKFRIQVAPTDCKGCAVCVQACPKQCLTMKPIETQLEQQILFDEELAKLKPLVDVDKSSIKDIQLAFPYFLSPGSCPGCPETVITRLLTTLFGDHLVVSSAVGCCLVWGHYNYLRPYLQDNDGRGPAVATSAFEDNSLYGLGIHLSDITSRNNLFNYIQKNIDKLQGEVQSEFKLFMEKFNDAQFTVQFEKNIGQLVNQIKDAAFKNYMQQHQMFVAKRSHWIIGGDGWSFDIDFGGVDHVMASGKNINILVFNNNCYANTGGQRSKATPAGTQMKNAYAGCDTQAKNMALMMTTYKRTYVAQVAFGANRMQGLKAIREAEAYNGPSMVICYCPCISHMVKGGLTNSEKQQKLAIDTGMWPLFRCADGVLTRDSKQTKQVDEFMAVEQRFSSLEKFDKQRSNDLMQMMKQDIEFTNSLLDKLEKK